MLYDGMPECEKLASAATVYTRGRTGCLCCSILIMLRSGGTFRLFIAGERLFVPGHLTCCRRLSILLQWRLHKICNVMHTSTNQSLAKGSPDEDLCYTTAMGTGRSEQCRQSLVDATALAHYSWEVRVQCCDLYAGSIAACTVRSHGPRWSCFACSPAGTVLGSYC